MGRFIKGMELCENFFNECARQVIEDHFPELRGKYSAGLIGYGSDVLGYDDAVSTDHMWGPRFYLFLDKRDISRKSEIFQALCAELPFTYEGYSVNFSEPDMEDCGVRHPEYIHEGKVNPLIFIQTLDEYLTEQLGTSDLDHIEPYEWLAFSEHRLLSLVSGKFFADGLNCEGILSKIKYYPEEVKIYLIASNWECISQEQAFVKRCGECGDDIGSRIICARICERLMRLCFLYKDTYAPYSKWFGTAFGKLAVDGKVKLAISGALSADSLSERERRLVEAQAMLAGMHNESGITEAVDYQVENYFGRDIKVIFADKFAEAAAERLKGTAFDKVPLIGTLSQAGGLAAVADDKKYSRQIMELYKIRY